MQTHSASFAAAALFVLASATACGRGPITPEIPQGDPQLTLTGRVVDATMGDEAGVADAVVMVTRDSFSTSTTTGADGTFVLGGLDAGQYMLSISHEGFVANAQSVFLDTNQDVTCFLDREVSDGTPTPERKGRFVIVKKGAQPRR